ncbi:hypothetical protein HWI79_2419 [Cryptosporidium felis]|nr:hypothetical protein HWI79_2419 [Cryptosporidium felis]
MSHFEDRFFENQLESWFSNTRIANFPDIQRTILEFSFCLKTSKKIASVNKQGFYFYRNIQKVTLGYIRDLEELEYQTWMDTSPNYWLCWVLMDNNRDEKNTTQTLVPLDPREVMDLIFRVRKIFPISYKTKIVKDNLGEPSLNVELSALSLGAKEGNSHEKVEKDSYSSIYEMLKSKALVFGFDLVFRRPIDLFETDPVSRGEIIISINPDHILDILSHRNFSIFLSSRLLGRSVSFILDDWSGYFTDSISKKMYGKFLKMDLLPFESYVYACARPLYPFLSILASSRFCRDKSAEVLNKQGKSLYEICINLLVEISSPDSKDAAIEMLESAILYSSPTFAFFLDSTFLTEFAFNLIFDLINTQNKAHFLDKNFQLSEELYETTQFNSLWDRTDENSPFFKSAHKSKYKPPWRTSVDNVINAMQEKQHHIISQQPSIAFGDPQPPLRNDGGYIRRMKIDSVESPEESPLFRNTEKTSESFLESEESQTESPSYVASGFVMGVRCLPASTAVTSLGSIIGNGNNSNSGNRGVGTLGAQSQRLSIPCSDRTGRLSSCRTFSSIATSWGTPVPITRTIPIDDILGRRRESIQSAGGGGRGENEPSQSEVRLNYNFESEEEQEQSREAGNLDEGDSEAVLESLSNLKIKEVDKVALAKETMKAWKYVNYDFDEELEGGSEEFRDYE